MNPFVSASFLVTSRKHLSEYEYVSLWLKSFELTLLTRERRLLFYTEYLNHFEMKDTNIARSRLGEGQDRHSEKDCEEANGELPDKFTTDFEENKQMVTQLLDSSTKWMRNRITGYVTTLKRIEERRKVATMTPAEEAPVESET